MRSIDFRALIWTLVIAILLSQIAAIQAVLRRVGLALDEDLTRPILRCPEPGPMIMIILRPLKKIQRGAL